MTDLTPEKLAELKRLLDEATPRPWEAYHPHPHYRQYAVDAVTPEGHLGYAVATTQDVQAEANAELIVAAVNALPVLLDAAAERDALAAKLDAVRALHGPRVVQVLGASLNTTWVEVPPDATIPAGTRVRAEYQEYANRAKEWATEVDRTPDMWQPGVVYLVPSGTVLEFPLDPRIEAVARAIAKSDCGDGGADWDGLSAAERDTYVAFAKAAIAALGEDI